MRFNFSFKNVSITFTTESVRNAYTTYMHATPLTITLCYVRRPHNL